MPNERPPHQRIDADQVIAEPQPGHKFNALWAGGQKTIGGLLHEPAILTNRSQHAAEPARWFHDRHGQAGISRSGLLGR